MSAISDNLIHFLARSAKDSPAKQFEVFKSIITNGLRTGRIQIKFGDGGSIFNQVVCLTDIPLRDCDEHTAVYGKFGIGFKKSFVKARGGNPARYFVDYTPGHISSDGPMESRGLLSLQLNLLQKTVVNLKHRLATDASFALFDSDQKEVLSTVQLDDLQRSVIYMLSFEKEMGDLGPARDDTDAVDLYYKEREWRLVPSKAVVDSGLAAYNDDLKYFQYVFGPAAVNMIVVPNDEMRSQVLGFLLGLTDSPDPRLRDFALNPLPIISYDDLQRW